ncbi:MAG TPA: hypothetical protein VHV30_15665 [Polyangiaceae bacterium]|jgi:hypothetical protein|nr:hypothetical protein [Polyangiaceae bacterium]
MSVVVPPDVGSLGETPAPGTEPRRSWTRWAGLFALESRSLTLLYWAGVAMVAAGFFVTRLLPCVDYPQHLALSDIARRLHDPNAPEHASYVLDYFTYNGLFHFVVATLSAVLPIELAGRSVVALSLVATAAGVLALLRALDRPLWHGTLFTPILFSFSLGWGFANYVLATAIAVWALVFVARAARRPSAWDLTMVGVLGFVCAFAHVLAMLVLCLGAAVVALEVAWRSSPGRPIRRAGTAVLRAAIVLFPLLAGCAYCVAVYQRQYAWNPVVYKDPTLEGTAPPLWQKVYFFAEFATDLYGDATDQVVLWASVALIAAVALHVAVGRAARRANPLVKRPPPMVGLFVAMTLAYFATPMVLVGTHLIFPRLAQWLVLGAVVAMPDPPARWAARARTAAAGLGLVAGVNALFHCAYFAWETNDASAMIDELPPGMSATAVIYDPWTASFINGTLTHLAAYYGARKHGAWAFSFARYLSVPVRFLPGATPPWPARGWEFSAEDYDPRCRYARAFPLVLVKAPDAVPPGAGSEARVRALVFKQDAAAVRLLSHHGAYWAFDTTGLPEDGAL